MLLLIILVCLDFTVSRGFRFDNYTGTVTATLPITLSWHREVGDPDNISFALGIIQSQGSFEEPFFSATDLSQFDGTVNVSFPVPGEYQIEAKNAGFGLATSQTFNVATSGGGSTTVSSSRLQSGSSVMETPGEPPSSATQSVQSTVNDQPTSNLTSRNHRISIVGTVIGSVVSILLVFGSGVFLFIRRRRRRDFDRLLLPHPELLSELNSHSPPVASVHKQSREMMLYVEGEIHRAVDGSETGNPIEDGRERRDDPGVSLHIDTSESESPEEQEAPQSAFRDVVTEVRRLRMQVQELITERETGRVQANALDSPPDYVSRTSLG
ncbi:hypothetical protein IW261DRAFT_1522666 [Armillaria novae-zelandiae]|uniref:Uncharacterized protein n=1 Tax=Armillaria novae-zelandiae TaxID=153914 RepID=A0AA39TP63_9AGAR|nr:hypothetical protein IW261DRAFT_1522666 [Armillaria novae-zelandiae]